MLPFLRDWFAAGCVLRAWHDPTNLIHNPFPTLPHATVADAQFGSRSSSRSLRILASSSLIPPIAWQLRSLPALTR